MPVTSSFHRTLNLHDLCVCSRDQTKDFVNCLELVEQHLSSSGRQPKESNSRLAEADKPQAGDTLVLRFQKPIAATVTKRMRRDRRQDIEDCTQEFWAKMFGHTEDGRWRLREWLTRIDRSPLCAFLRTSVGFHVIDWNLRKVVELTGIDIEGISGGGSSKGDAPERLAAVYECLSQVSPEYQKLFRLRIEQQLEWANIARELGVSERTAFNRWNNLLERLRRYLKIKGFDL